MKNTTHINFLFDDLKAKYEDFCWFEVTDETYRARLEKQAQKEIGVLSPLYSIKDTLVAVAKSERQDDVLFFDGIKYIVVHLAWNDGNDSGPRYKELRPDELNRYMEWYYLNV